ncbi:hypothetical protein [Rosistilla oblonga]|uniref:hypothetical protein n=1 Tax=Rosistilla oblonga TaxID=2527990 RepID=UPI003A96ACFC
MSFFTLRQTQFEGESRTSAALFGEALREIDFGVFDSRTALPEKLAKRSFFDPPGVAGRVKLRVLHPPQKQFEGEGRTSAALFGEALREIDFGAF